jgi:DNA invertase Pin-like site-specific DNA recombinase
VTKAGIYVRISADRLGDAAGVRRQRKECEALCKSLKWQVVAVYEDNDVSAYRNRKRRGYEHLISDLKDGTINAIVARHPDRLVRRTRELEDLIDLIEATGAKVKTVMAGDYDLSTASGRMAARVVGAVAQHESEQKSERIKAKARELAEQGKVGGGGTRPFGYQKDRRRINQREARFVREAVQQIIGGASLRSIAADWNRRGIKTPTGGEWSTPALRRMLTSARIAGWREHSTNGRWQDREMVAPAEWKGIIDRETLEEVRAILRDPDRTKRRMPPRKYLLMGLMKCGLCGAKLIARPRQDKQRCYVCATGPNFKGCGKIRTLSEPVEDLVTAAALIRLDSPKVRDGLRRQASDGSDQSKRSAAELVKLESRLDRLTIEYSVEGLHSKAQFQKAKGELDRRIEKLRRELAAGRRPSAALHVPEGGAALRKWWDGATIEQQKRLLETVIDKIVINPAVKGRNTFDPERVDVIWRA